MRGEGVALRVEKDVIEATIERQRMALEEATLAAQSPPAVYAVSAEKAIRLLIAQLVGFDLWTYWRELSVQARAERDQAHRDA
jgi:hypothetical protein